MSDDLSVLGADNIKRSYDEHYDTMMDVEQDPTGAWQAIQEQHNRIEELEKRLKASEERSDVLEELVMDVVHDLRDGVSGSKIDSRICKVMKKLEWGE